jgi:type I restriction enzyme R subunit
VSWEYSEDQLAQKPTAEYLEKALQWKSVYAYNQETFGPQSLLGRSSDREVVLKRELQKALVRLNPGLPEPAYDDAIRQITAASASKSLIQINREQYALHRNGVLVSYRNSDGKKEERRLRLFDFQEPANNDFLAVRELWIQGPLYRRRADIIGFVNGLPLVFFEMKNLHKSLRKAYEENLADYRDAIPHLLHHNALIILGNGSDALVGSLTSGFKHFFDWKRLAEEDPGVVNMETLLKGLCSKTNFMDIFENFILFDDSGMNMAKIIARNHQFLGVNRAVESVKDRRSRQGKLGVFWHTQGSGKSYSMVFFSEKIRRKLSGDFSFLVLTDREDLETQIYKTYGGCGFVDNKKDHCRASSGEDLEAILRQNKPYIFSMIQKFHRDVDPAKPYSNRDGLIVISDEAHRTQYGRLADHMRLALPSAGFIGFTGTPLIDGEELTRDIFGDYISTYPFQRAVEDKATAPLKYDSRGEKLGIAQVQMNERIAAKLEEVELDPEFTQDQRARLEADLAREYHVYTAQKRLEMISHDFIEHVSQRWEQGKSMLVCIDKITAGRMQKLIADEWQVYIRGLELRLPRLDDEQESVMLQRRIRWMKETEILLIVSEEQGEVDKFRQWGLDIQPHRKRMKDGYAIADGRKITVDAAFKDENHPFRIAVVCAMWLTGFDVPSLSTLYLDKPLKAHTLMQAIARANRVYEGKENGLIVDYCGILKNLRKALAVWATGKPAQGDDKEPGPIGPEEDLLVRLKEALTLAKDFLEELGAPLEAIVNAKGFPRNAAIVTAKNAVNRDMETRKRFEIQAREVFRLFKACLTQQGLREYRSDYYALDELYRKIQEGRDRADISAVIRELQGIVDDAVTPRIADVPEERLFDISRIDFERLKQEFAKSKTKNSGVYCLQEAVEQRLRLMIGRNPLRKDFYDHYQKIVEGYNLEKDRKTIEETWEALIKLMKDLDEEEARCLREGLENDEQLAIFDLLIRPEKPELTPQERGEIKQSAKGLLEKLQQGRLRFKQWKDNDSTQAEVRVAIRDYLYDDSTGLPARLYTPEEVAAKAGAVYEYIFFNHSAAA